MTQNIRDIEDHEGRDVTLCWRDKEKVDCCSRHQTRDGRMWDRWCSVPRCAVWPMRGQSWPHLTNQRTRSRQFCGNHDPGLFSQKNTITLLLCPSGPGVGVKRLNSANRGGTEHWALSRDLGLAWSLQVGSCSRGEVRERVFAILTTNPSLKTS